MGKRNEGGLDAALQRLDEVYYSTDMTEEEYRKRKGRITEQYLDSPSGGLIERAVNGDAAAGIRLGIYVVVGILAFIAVLAVLSFAFGEAAYVGGDD